MYTAEDMLFSMVFIYTFCFAHQDLYILSETKLNVHIILTKSRIHWKEKHF